MKGNPVIVWFRQDLRLADNPALDHAVKLRRPVLPLFIFEDNYTDARPLGAASRWWLHHSLVSLNESLRGIGTGLIIRSGDPEEVILCLTMKTGAELVCWNRRYDPHSIACDTRLKSTLRDKGCQAESFNATLLREPWELQTKAGKPIKVFSAFWRAFNKTNSLGPTLHAPKTVIDGTGGLTSDTPLDLALLSSKPNWSNRPKPTWVVGEASAKDRAVRFVNESLPNYASGKDLPGEPNTSRLSPHLHFGEIGPRQLWHAVASAAQKNSWLRSCAEKFQMELAWREFNYHLLYYNPEMPKHPIRQEFSRFLWREEPHALRSWQGRRTGVPIVDAGLRELWETGYMNNRVRMIAASFLTKNLLVHWRHGEAWFWDTLMDADIANNSAAWQWVAGCGADAAPFFRIFNPVHQGERFDAQGKYVRHWVPELIGLQDRFVHQPWAAPLDVLRDAGVILGQTYPHPIVDLSFTRNRALATFKRMRAVEAKSEVI